jgi:hypothetical protein
VKACVAKPELHRRGALDLCFLRMSLHRNRGALSGDMR